VAYWPALLKKTGGAYYSESYKKMGGGEVSGTFGKKERERGKDFTTR